MATYAELAEAGDVELAFCWSGEVPSAGAAK
jgi:hypothetical protein